MKMRSTIKCVVLLVLMATPMFGQVTLEGIVADSITQEPLVGASVFLLGTSIGTATDLQGEYKITNIPEGLIEYVYLISVMLQRLLKCLLKVKKQSKCFSNYQAEQLKEKL
jgi:hypothetical protein